MQTLKRSDELQLDSKNLLDWNWFKKHKILRQVEEMLKNKAISEILAQLRNKDPDTFKHCHRVGQLSCWMGSKLGLKRNDLADLFLAGLMHDVGKINTPDSILKKPGSLTDEEFAQMKQHPLDSERLVKRIKDYPYLQKIVRGHHERYDGRGYPDGLAGEDIPLYCRIIFVIDTFDAMTNNRIYRKAISFDEVYEEIKLNAGKQFDPEIAQIFVHSHRLLEEDMARDRKAA